MKTFIIWLNCLIRSSLGRRRYVGVTPPYMKVQRVYDKVNRKWHVFNIRDADDWIQIEHIFLNDEFDLTGTERTRQIGRLYDGIIESGKSPLITDLGANIGLASRYFHDQYPKADIISIEPDQNNCAVARTNLPNCATLIEAAVSSKNGSVSMIDTGRNCGFQVDVSKDGGIPLITVPDILSTSPDTVPFMIKIDIEGFEEDLFRENTDWIDLFPILLIELHDWMLPGRQVTKNFILEMAKRDRDFMHFNGYVVSLAQF